MVSDCGRGGADRMVPKPGVGVVFGARIVAGPMALLGAMVGGTKGFGADGEGTRVRPAAGPGGAVPGAWGGEDGAGVGVEPGEV